jgi:hypothetical protein
MYLAWKSIPVKHYGKSLGMRHEWEFPILATEGHFLPEEAHDRIPLRYHEGKANRSVRFTSQGKGGPYTSAHQMRIMTGMHAGERKEGCTTSERIRAPCSALLQCQKDIIQEGG